MPGQRHCLRRRASSLVCWERERERETETERGRERERQRERCLYVYLHQGSFRGAGFWWVGGLVRLAFCFGGRVLGL